MPEKIKCAFIGAGYIGKVQISQLLRLKPKVSVEAIVEKNANIGKQIAEEFEIREVYSDYHDVLNDPKIQVIHNCTPNNIHFKINKEAIEKGKHVFSEKPLAISAEDGLELARLAKRHNVEAGVNFCYRYYPVVQDARARIKSGEIGEVLSVIGSFLQDWLLFQNDFNWRLTASQAGDSYIMADLGSHWCDLVQHVTGLKITKVMADLHTIYPVRKKPKGKVVTFAKQDNVEYEEVKCSLDDFASLLIEFETGARGVFATSSLCAGRKVSIDMQIYGSKKSFCWNHERHNELWIGNRDRANEIFMESPLLQTETTRKYALLPSGHPMGYHDAEFNLFSEFYNAVGMNIAENKGGGNYPTFEEAANELVILEAAIKSSKEKQWININNRVV